MEIQSTAILFQIVNFGVVVGALTVLLYKPILKVFEERTKRIEEGQKAAAEAIQQRQAIDEFKAKSSSEAQAERLALIATAQQEAQLERQKIIAAAHAEASQHLATVKAEWETEKARLLENTKGALSAAVVTVTERVIHKKLTAADQETLVASELETILKGL